MSTAVDVAAAKVRRRVILDVEFPASADRDGEGWGALERELKRLNRITGIEDCLNCGQDYAPSFKKTGRGYCPECHAKYGRR